MTVIGAKGEIKPKAVWACLRFSQKMMLNQTFFATLNKKKRNPSIKYVPMVFLKTCVLF